MEQAVKNEFVEDNAAALQALFVEIGGKALQKSLEVFSAEHARRSRELGKIDEEIKQKQIFSGNLDRTIIGKKAEAGEVTQRLEQKKAEEKQRDEHIAEQKAEEARLERRLDSLRATLAQESRA